MKKTIKKILSFLLIFSIIIIQIPAISFESTIKISTEKQLINFAKKCSVDTWSQNKTVLLVKNIDLTNTDFEPIPTFNGTFDGNNHFIKGFKYTKNGSAQGLFRYIGSMGTVKNLHLEGNVVPGGTSSKIGGIAGVNNGKILNCTFSGNIHAKKNNGGIAGINSATAVISDCTVTGSIYGEHYSGGIAGQNLGTIISCINNSNVNTTISKVSFDIENIDFDKLVSTQNTVEITDIGGICGFSSGILQSCVNNQTIGYKHVGYNIGGICGRQVGYIGDCVNNGEVFGRKDVGGIVGQIEPHTALEYSPDSLNSLSTELNKLKSMLNSTLNEADAVQMTLSSGLSEATSYTSRAIDNANELSNKTRDLLNTNTDNLNNASAKITGTLNTVSTAMDEMDTITDDLQAFVDTYSDITDSIDKSVNLDDKRFKQNLDNLSESISTLKKGMSNMQDALKYLRRSLNDVDTVVYYAKQVVTAIKNLSTAISETKTNVDAVATSAKDISTQLQNKNYSELADYFAKFSDALTSTIPAIDNIYKNMDSLTSAFSDLGTAFSELQVSNLTDAVSGLANGFGNISSSLNNIVKIINDIKDNVNIDELNGIPDKIKTGNTHLSNALTSLKNMTNTISKAFKDVSSDPLISITPIDDDYIATVDSLTDSLKGISNSLNSINSTLSSNVTKLISDIKATSDQMFVVFDVMIDAIQNSYTATDIKDELSDRTADISDEDTEAQTTGKADNSKNNATINGDINVGGIAGSLAIEYDFDPEDDITNNTDKKSTDFLFTARAVVRNCENFGDVLAKKNYVGGIVGRINLGCVISSIACGNIESSSGDYVGGIVGKSESTVKKCSSRCIISGDDYTGGIAGEASHLYDCTASAYIKESDEFTGGIAGNTDGECNNNFYCGESLGAIDSISYSSTAEKTDIDTLKNSTNGYIFNTFKAVFKIKDKVYDTLYFSYGDTIPKNKIPKLPKVEGYYGKWDNDSFENITHDIITNAKYKRFISSIEGGKERENGLAPIVCEGLYTKDTVLTAQKLDKKIANPLKTTVEVWKVSTTDNQEKETTIHYCVPQKTKGKLTVLKYDGHKYKKVDYETDGNYIIFKSYPYNTTFAIVKNSILRNILNFVFVVMLICILLFILQKKFKIDYKTILSNIKLKLKKA